MADPTGSRVKSRAAWSLLAQALGSTYSLLTTIFAARALTAVQFGYFAALVTVALLFVGLVASLVAQPLLLSHGGPDQIAVQARSMLFAAPFFGALGGVVMVMASPFVGQADRGLWIVAAAAPLAAASEVFRYFGTVVGRPHLAVGLEMLRLIVFFGGYILLNVEDTTSAVGMLALWCGASAIAGTIALGVGARLTRLAASDRRQFLTPKFLGYQFGLEYLMGVVARGIPILSLGLFVSVVAIGNFRGMLTLFGPILVLATGVVTVLSPYLVANPGRPRSRALIGMGALFTFASLTWMAILLVMPESLGREILGDAWSGSRQLIVPVALQMVGTGILTTAQTGVRVMRPRYSLLLNVSATSWFLASFLVGVLIGDLQGAAWGFAVGAFGAAAIAVGLYLRVERQPEFRE